MRRRFILAMAIAALVVGVALAGVQAGAGSLVSRDAATSQPSTAPSQPDRQPATGRRGVDQQGVPPAVNPSSTSTSSNAAGSTSRNTSITRSYSSSSVTSSTIVIVNGEIVVRNVVRLSSEDRSD